LTDFRIKFVFVARRTGNAGRSVVSRGGFYAWLTRSRSRHSRSDADAGAKFVPAFWRAIGPMAPAIRSPKRYHEPASFRVPGRRSAFVAGPSSRQPHSRSSSIAGDELNPRIFQRLLRGTDGSARDIAARFLNQRWLQPEAGGLGERRLSDVQQRARHCPDVMECRITIDGG
jgi:hypothetical protein